MIVPAVVGADRGFGAGAATRGGGGAGAGCGAAGGLGRRRLLRSPQLGGRLFAQLGHASVPGRPGG